MNNFKKLLFALITLSLGAIQNSHASGCSTWSISGKCYTSSPTQVISQVNGVFYNESQVFDNCAMQCGANWDYSMSSSEVNAYTNCVNQCASAAGFTQVNACGAQKILQQSNCYGR